MKKRIIVGRLLAVAGILFGILGAGKDCAFVQAAAGEVQEAETSVSDAEKADGIAELSQIMTAVEDVDMKAAPEEGAAVVRFYEKGDSVFVTGRTEDGWYRVIYQDLEGYMPESALSEKELDVEGLDAEMSRTEQEAAFVVEMVEKYRDEARRSKIWGSVIVVLVVGIFATGILSGIRSSRRETQD